MKNNFNLADFFLSELPFFEFQGESLSFKQVWELSQKYPLPKIAKKEVVGIICRTNPQTLFAIFKLLSAGAIPALISPKSTLSEIENLSLKKIIDPLNSSSSTSEYLQSIISLDDTALICFTSGSTGKPKAVPLSFKNIFYSAMGSNEFYHLDKSDRYLLTLPLNHVGGLMPVFRGLLAKFVCIFPEKGISHGEYHPTVLSLVPTQLFRISHEEFLKSCKAILVGGDKFPTERFAMIRYLPVSLTYGMTETCSQVAASAPYQRQMKILPYRKIKISNEGLVLIGGETLFSGYLREKTEFDREGYFQTSDLGNLVENTLEIYNRKDDIFIRGGENISGVEIESVVYKLAFIEKAKVIPVKDDLYGEIPILFFQSKEILEEKSLKEHLSQYLPPYKLPHRCISVPYRNDFKWEKSKLLELLEYKK